MSVAGGAQRFSFVCALLCGCHAEQKFPVAAPSAAPVAPQIQLFEAAPSGLDDARTFTDLSALNPEPAGTHGFVRAAGAHFVDDRGTRLRFFGVNLTGVACLPDPETALRLAKHFRKLGFNAVRLEGLDVKDGLIDERGELVPEALARLDHFTAALKAEGLYFTFGLHALSGYPGLEGEALARFPQGKVLDRFARSFLVAQRNTARRLLSHENAETKLPYSAEPALLYVELNNEDTIFPSRAGSPDDAPANYRAELARGYAPWLAERTAEGLRAPGPALEEAKGELPTFESSADARADYAQYLRATELDNVKQLAAFIRGELKLHSMLLNTQASFGGLAGVLREAEVSDFIDVHGFWDHPRASESDQAATRSLQNDSQITAVDGGTLGVMASYRVFGKPFSVSEYASAAPNDYVEETFPLLIGIAGLQDWDALFAFAYADQKREYEPKRINGVFDLAGHPTKLAFITAAATAFRGGLVAAGTSRVELFVPREPLALPIAENALPTLWNASGVPLTAAALRQVGISLRDGGGSVAASYALHVSGALGSDSGELYWEPRGEHPRFSIDAPSLKLVCGEVAQSALKFGEFSLEFANFAGGFACASLVALDGAPLRDSRRVLFNVAGRAQNAHRPAAAEPNVIGPLGDGPPLSQFIPVTLSLPRADWHAQALDTKGAVIRSIPVATTIDSKLATRFDSPALAYALTR